MVVVQTKSVLNAAHNIHDLGPGLLLLLLLLMLVVVGILFSLAGMVFKFAGRAVFQAQQARGQHGEAHVGAGDHRFRGGRRSQVQFELGGNDLRHVRLDGSSHDVFTRFKTIFICF